MTTESRQGKDTGVGEEMRKIAATTKAKPSDLTKPKDVKATASGGDRAAGFSLPNGSGKNDRPAPATPTPQAQAAPPAPVRTYTVKSGDTLWDIALSHYGDGRQYRKIASANNIADPNRISAGLELTIPQ